MADQELLRDYAERRSEAAFAQLVQRHVDFVYSAALRMVRDAHLAEDVTQGVFLALAQNARQLTQRPVLSGWLHRTAQNLAANAVRSEVRRRAREQEAAAMNKSLTTDADAHWQNIALHLDAALGELNEPDRDAVLLRYFEHKSAREMAQALAISDEAAQKRVTRAVERLRESFAKRGVTVGASGLVTLVAANAVQAAPAGFGAAISTAAALAENIATATATQAIAMTTLQKTLIATVLTASIGTGIYQTAQNSKLRGHVQGLEQQQSPLLQQVQQLQREREDVTNQLGALLAENAQLKSKQSTAELLKLRGEVARLRIGAQELAQRRPAVDPNDPAVQNFLAAKAQATQIANYLEQMPEKKIPELTLLTDVDWLTASKEAKFDTEADVRRALSHLRSLAKQRLPLGRTLSNFAQANNGQLPTDMSQLKPYFKSAFGDTAPDDATLDAILGRYRLLQTGNLNELPPDAWIIAEKAPVDKEYDSRAKFGSGRSTVIGTGLHSAGDPDDKTY